MSKSAKNILIMILILISTIIIIFTYLHLKNAKEIELIKEKLINIEYDKIEVTSKKCNGDCKRSLDGSCFSYEKLDNCKRYDIKIYMNKNDIIHAKYEIFDDGAIRENTIDTNINEYLKIKKIIDFNMIRNEYDENVESKIEKLTSSSTHNKKFITYL